MLLASPASGGDATSQISEYRNLHFAVVGPGIPPGLSFLHGLLVALHYYRLARIARFRFWSWCGGVSWRTEWARSSSFVEVSTGIEMDLATLNQLGLASVFCPHCRQPHQMIGIEYWLSQVDEPSLLEVTAEAA